MQRDYLIGLCEIFTVAAYRRLFRIVNKMTIENYENQSILIKYVSRKDRTKSYSSLLTVIIHTSSCHHLHSYKLSPHTHPTLHLPTNLIVLALTTPHLD